MKRKHLSALVMALMLATAIPALGANDFTVGQFLQELARAKNVNATDARIAVDSLRSVGIHVPASLDVNAALTERAVVDIAKAAGLRVSTNSPSASFDEDQVDSFFSAFAVELEGNDLEEPDPNTVNVRDPDKFDPFTKGKSPNSKGNRTPTEPE